jgi:hypothetical protein
LNNEDTPMRAARADGEKAEMRKAEKNENREQHGYVSPPYLAATGSVAGLATNPRRRTPPNFQTGSKKRK